MTKLNQSICAEELSRNGLLPKKFYGQVFTADEAIIEKFIETIASIYRPGTRIIEIGTGLGYITEGLIKSFGAIDGIEFDKELFNVLYKKCIHNESLQFLKEKSDTKNKIFIQKIQSENGYNSDKNNNFPAKDEKMNKKIIHPAEIKLIKGDILKMKMPEEDYLLVGNIPFHISGRLYRRFMSDEKHKPYGMVFITDKQYAETLMGQPPRCYRVSLQAQAYGNIEITADVPPSSVYPQPKVISCIMKITHNPVPLPKNFWKVVNYHYENFPTKEVESPKTLSLQDWIRLCK